MAWDGKDHTDVVAEAKRRLVALGVDLSTPCGAHAIVNVAAWMLRASGAGLLAKTTGANCDGRAIDVVAYQDGTVVDCLIEKLGAQTPTWQVQPGQVDPSRWLAPIEPKFLTPPTEPPAPAPIEPTVDVATRLARIDNALALLAAQSDANTHAIQQQIDQAIHNAEKSAAPIVALLERLTK